ncbi:Ig-like domain-containing protein [Candidatus Saccharibacteria bacterium]|nr:Ig-like domain-containing protein [Candidatus Saccharibacteria bacterium]
MRKKSKKVQTQFKEEQINPGLILPTPINQRKSRFRLYSPSGKGWKSKALIFMLAFGVIGGFFLYRSFAETPYGDILTGADQLVLRYELPYPHNYIENEFEQVPPPATLLYGNGLMLCHEYEKSRADTQTSPLMFLKERQLASGEIAILVDQIRALGFDDMFTRTLPDTIPPAVDETPSISLFTTSGEREVVLYPTEKLDKFDAIAALLSSECKKAKTDFDPDEVILESIKLPDMAESTVATLPNLSVSVAEKDNDIQSKVLSGDEAKNIKGLIAKGNKIYKAPDGKKIKVRVIPKVPDYQISKRFSKSSGGNVASAANIYKVRFVYIYAADQAPPTSDQLSGFVELMNSLPGYYSNNVNKPFTSQGLTVMQATKNVADYHVCPDNKCVDTNTGEYMGSLATYKNLELDSNIKKAGISTVVAYNWNYGSEVCRGWGGPTHPESEFFNYVGVENYGVAAFAAAKCMGSTSLYPPPGNPSPNLRHKVGAHEVGHTFGLGHDTELTMMHRGGVTMTTFGYGIPLNPVQATLLRDLSLFFREEAGAVYEPGPVTSGSTFVSINPARLLETRPNLSTVDGNFNGINSLVAGSTTKLQVGGRAGMATNARAAALNVTAINPIAAGYMVVFPCDTGQPKTSNVNYNPGITVSNFVISRLDGNGQVCIYTNNAIDLVVDINGVFPSGSTTSYTNISPVRILETRGGLLTEDGQFNGINRLPAGSVTQLTVNGRVGIPSNASAVSLNATVIDPAADGFMVIYPCNTSPPSTSSINYMKSSNISNAVISKVGNGSVCIYTNNAIDLVVDINGAFNDYTSFKSVPPKRLLETRPGLITYDGISQGINRLGAGSITEFQVAGRAEVPNDALATALNVTVINAQYDGFMTVYPCGIPLPKTSNVNFNANTTVSIAAFSKIGVGSSAGKVCLYTNVATDAVVDVNGAFVISDGSQSALTAVDPVGVSPAPPTTVVACPSGYIGTYPNCVIPVPPDTIARKMFTWVSNSATAPNIPDYPYCARMDASATDPHTWADNWLCSHFDYGLRLYLATAPLNHASLYPTSSIFMAEPAHKDAGWGDSSMGTTRTAYFLQSDRNTPSDFVSKFTWSYVGSTEIAAGLPDARSCTAWSEPSEPASSMWSDNYLCGPWWFQTIPPTPPVVSITAPASNSTVSNIVTISANATDAKGISVVQFKLDGNNLGVEDATAPYSINWDSKTVNSGNHTLTAVARNVSGLSTTSAPVTVNVQLPPPPQSTAQGTITSADCAIIRGTAYDADWPAGGIRIDIRIDSSYASNPRPPDGTVYTDSAGNWSWSIPNTSAYKTSRARSIYFDILGKNSSGVGDAWVVGINSGSPTYGPCQVAMCSSIQVSMDNGVTYGSNIGYNGSANVTGGKAFKVKMAMNNLAPVVGGSTWNTGSASQQVHVGTDGTDTRNDFKAITGLDYRTSENSPATVYPGQVGYFVWGITAPNANTTQYKNYTMRFQAVQEWVEWFNTAGSSNTGNCQFNINVTAPIISKCSGVTIYSDSNFIGGSSILSAGYSTTRIPLGSDTISSARIPKGCKLRLFLNNVYSGAMHDLTSDWPGSVSDPWNDKASALQVTESDTITATTPITCPSNSVTLFKDSGYLGSSKILSNGKYDVRQLSGIGDNRLSSVKVPLGCKVILYQNSGFGGATKVLNGDWTSTADDPWNDITSSIEVKNRATAVASTEMLQNPGFEQGNVVWTTSVPSGVVFNYNVLSTAGQAKEGTKYMEANSTPYGASLYQVVTANQEPGSTYRWSAWVRSPSCTPVNGHVTLWSVWATVTNSYTGFTADCTWRQITTTFTATNTGDTQFLPYITLLTGGVNLDIDSASLVKINYVE